MHSDWIRRAMKYAEEHYKGIMFHDAVEESLLKTTRSCEKCKFFSYEERPRCNYHVYYLRNLGFEPETHTCKDWSAK